MNHDVNFLSAGEGIEKAYYMMKYTTKARNEVENPLAIHMHAFDKAVSKRGDASDAILEGRRLVQSMCCTLSKPQEVSGPMAALFLLRESPFYSSCSFEKLFLGSIATVVLEGEAVDVMLHAAGSGATFQPSSPLLDCIQLPDELANTCLIDFRAAMDKTIGTKGFRFQRDHAQYGKYTVHSRRPPAVATIIG
ncbi:hypothetical protein PI124_g5090, partial [Phytophthora idaei]